MNNYFPPLSFADENGLLGASREINTEMLLEAYSKGIFPWPVASDSDLLPWFSPPTRGILRVKNFHISRSLQARLKKREFQIRWDSDFEEIINQCRAVRKQETWISDKLRDAFIDFNKAGFCFSIGAYEESELVGGMYGVKLGQFYAGESMFYNKTNASKFCLVSLVERLSAEGIEWFDCQQVTPLLASFGAEEVSRDEFIRLLGEIL